jgi:hypothetical protein
MDKRVITVSFDNGTLLEFIPAGQAAQTNSLVLVTESIKNGPIPSLPPSRTFTHGDLRENPNLAPLRASILGENSSSRKKIYLNCNHIPNDWQRSSLCL